MKKTVFVLTVLLLLLASCGKDARDQKMAETKKALDEFKKVYNEMFEVIISEKENPDTALKNAEKFIEGKKALMEELNSLLMKDLDLEKESVIADFNRDLMSILAVPGGDLTPIIKKAENGAERFEELSKEIKQYHTIGKK